MATPGKEELPRRRLAWTLLFLAVVEFCALTAASAAQVAFPIGLGFVVIIVTGIAGAVLYWNGASDGGSGQT